MVRRRVRIASVLALLVVGATGCERGCLKKHATDLFAPGAGGGELPRGRGELPRSAACPEDVARCVGGRVRAAGRLAPETRCSPEGCPCPWDDLGACSNGCVVDGLEMDITRERALAQLCAPAPSVNAMDLALPVPAGSLPFDASLPEDADTVDVACEIERYRCDRGVVFACRGAGVSQFRCLRDCAEEGSVVLADVTPQQAAMLLCRR